MNNNNDSPPATVIGSMISQGSVIEGGVIAGVKMPSAEVNIAIVYSAHLTKTLRTIQERESNHKFAKRWIR